MASSKFSIPANVHFHPRSSNSFHARSQPRVDAFSQLKLTFLKQSVNKNVTCRSYAVLMREQFSMSIRLQRQRGTLPSHVSPWLGALLVSFLVGAWVWMQQPETSMIQAKPPEPSAAARMTEAQRPNPGEAAPEPIAVASLQRRSTRARVLPKADNPRTATIPYTFLFEGRSMSGDEPCPNTYVLVRLQEGSRVRVAHGITDGSGYYSIPLTFEMIPKASVDWTLQANRKQYQSLEMSGRHIAITGDTSVTVERSFNLAFL